MHSSGWASISHAILILMQKQGKQIVSCYNLNYFHNSYFTFNALRAKIVAFRRFGKSTKLERYLY